MVNEIELKEGTYERQSQRKRDENGSIRPKLPWRG